MNAHVNGKEDDEEEIEAVARSATPPTKMMTPSMKKTPMMLMIALLFKEVITGTTIVYQMQSCKHENWNVVAKYLTEDLPLFLTSKNLKDVNDVLCMVFRSTPSSLRDFIKWIVEIQRQDDGVTSADCLPTLLQEEVMSVYVNDQLEEKWYGSPEEINEGVCTILSNIYSLGVLLFELLCQYESERAHAAAMLDLCHRIFPPTFLSENLKEAGFCLRLLHPEPSLRPTTRDILQSEVLNRFQEVFAEELSSSINRDDTESELLLHFLGLSKEKKQKHASKLMEDIACLEVDIKEVEKRECLTI
ncbi:hypothetical protein PVK06_029006 [Gossypium arboreum]|uniref:Phytochelatin synthase C-terminal domain-containing protein n=1 Tax=Gossypium arboreum TaxID=29729 RepID=A0ABR0P5E0_GOSAR|nr:hypothetical protein PVK06_029006 [Gossypium arboreum]